MHFFKRPPLVIVAKDRDGKVVAAEKIVTDDTVQTTYGKGDCRFWFPGVIDSVFPKGKADFIRTLQAICQIKIASIKHRGDFYDKNNFF